MFCDEVVSLHNDIRNMFSRMHPPLPPAPEAEKIMSALGDHATATLDDEDGTGRNGIELGVSAAAEATTTPMAELGTCGAKNGRDDLSTIPFFC